MDLDAHRRTSPISRRQLLQRTLLGAAVASSMSARPAPGHASARPGPARNPAEALRDLLEGNKRFMSGRTTAPRRQPSDFAALSASQSPDAVIVGCADSRVPPEIVFDQGVGDLFVVRVAGNVVSGTGLIVKGSIEYAVAELGVPLIMVLGHSGCGAVKAALEHIESSDQLPGAIRGLVDILRPVVARVQGEPGDRLENAIRANVAASVDRLKGLAPVLAPAVKKDTLRVVGAVYDLRSGSVTQVV
jgi:carbonic anhydrase